MKQPLEQQLLRRLTYLGLILLAFALIALFFDHLPDFSEEAYLLEEEIEETPPLNPFLASTSFALVGTLCLFISWKKRKRLQKEDPE